MKKGRRVTRKQENKKVTNADINNKKKIIKKILSIIIAIIVLVIICIVANHFIILDKNKRTNLVINNKNVTSNLKNEILIEDDIIYLSQQIQNFFDKYIYKEEQTNQIITTYNKKIAAIGFEENIIIINGSKKPIYAHTIEKDGTTYLPISEMKDVYDIQIENIENTKVITMDSLDREQKKAIVTSNLSVRSSTKFIAKTIDRIKKGDYVVVISNDKNYTKIRTENGKIGYIKSNKLANEITVREEMQEEKQIEGKVNLTWDYFSTVGSAPDRTGTSIDGINVVSPAFFYLDKKGELQENIGNAGEKYIQWAHDNGYKVWPMISNADAGLQVTSTIMNSYQKRQELIENIVDKCVEYKIESKKIKIYILDLL